MAERLRVIMSKLMQYDVLIRGGWLVDGLGNTPYQADIGIQNEQIVAIAPSLKEGAKMVFEAEGLWVTPGFINMHAHSDCSVIMNREMESALGQGITTEFVGHCGLGIAPVEKYWLYSFAEKKLFMAKDAERAAYFSPYSMWIEPTEAIAPLFQEIGRAHV